MLKHITAVILLGLASLFAALQPAIAQSPQKTTASEVVDAETLEAFVLYAKITCGSFYRSQRPRAVSPKHQRRRRLETREHVPHHHVARWHGVSSRR